MRRIKKQMERIFAKSTLRKFNFVKQWIFIRFVGTHSEYNKINANTI